MLWPIVACICFGISGFCAGWLVSQSQKTRLPSDKILLDGNGIPLGDPPLKYRTKVRVKEGFYQGMVALVEEPHSDGRYVLYSGRPFCSKRLIIPVKNLEIVSDDPPCSVF